MAITILPDRIQIGNFSLTETSTGFSFNGKVNSIVSGVTQAQGYVAGYTSGGSNPSVPPTTPILLNVIDRFPFASDANATDVGDLTVGRYGGAGQSSSTHGYTSGGSNPSLPLGFTNTIDKFPFATNANATDVGDLIGNKLGSFAGQSSTVSGYASGSGTAANASNIDKFPFATDANATYVGNLTAGRSESCGQSSSTHGYTSGGRNTSGTTTFNVIDKFPFASDANATDVGDLTVARINGPTGQSSFVSGYTSGGNDTLIPARYNIIDRFPFATDANATDVGDLSVATTGLTGQSSNVSGYTSGGFSPTVALNTIEKFPFATNTNATDVGDLTSVKSRIVGQQY